VDYTSHAEFERFVVFNRTDVLPHLSTVTDSIDIDRRQLPPVAMRRRAVPNALDSVFVVNEKTV
jgi:hypothetical protein